MTNYMVEGLAKARAELAGEIERTHERLRKLALDLEHIDATLRIVAPEMAVEAIKPKVFRPPADWAKRGEMSRLVLLILRTAKAPMTTREIAERMLVERGIPSTTTALNDMTRRVAHALRIQRERGTARSSEGEAGFWLLWEIVRD
ncbi:MAG: hypothetical protein K2P79_05875 [Sphingomonas sp.]|nr:hypothetical protein [Sphingomonas sp.]